MSSSHPPSSLGVNTTRGGSLQWMPSGLSTRAMLFWGRHETHIRYFSPSFRTEISKHVPYFPPKTGLPSNLLQPPAVSTTDDKAAADASTTSEVEMKEISAPIP